jgi:hypothetical protein
MKRKNERMNERKKRETNEDILVISLPDLLTEIRRPQKPPSS